jgi:hypothetical protein
MLENGHVGEGWGKADKRPVNKRAALFTGNVVAARRFSLLTSLAPVLWHGSHTGRDTLTRIASTGRYSAPSHCSVAPQT